MKIKCTNLRGKLLFLTIVMVMMIIVSCQGSIVKIGYRCFNDFQKLDCHYEKFTGREEVSEELQPGENLELTYELNVKRGTLSFRIIGPSGTILWESEFAESEKGDVHILAKEEGLHEMIVEGEGTQGGFLITWSIQ